MAPEKARRCVAVDPRASSPLGTASFDVFETLLVRRLGEPSSLFLLLGRRLADANLIETTPEIFARERMQAAIRAKRRSGRCDPSLEAIYAELGAPRSWPSATRADLRAAELDLETELLVAWPPGCRALRRARQLARQVIFVSDTYLPGWFIRDRLREHHLYEPGDLIFASCDSEGTKADRTLFPRVRSTFADIPGRFVHVGNHPRADIAAANAAGLNTRHLASGNLTRYEQLLERSRWLTGGLSSSLAGASRLARAEVRPGTPEATITAVAAGVAGPLLVGFVIWLIQQAEREDIDRLYFLSREGQVLARIATILAPKLGSRLDVRYLHVSRQAVNLAAVERASPVEIAWTLTHSDTNTVRTLLRRVGLEPEAVAGELASIGLTESSWGSVPAHGLWLELLARLSRPPLSDAVVGAARDERPVVEAYLEGTGFFEDVRVGLVDVSGVGSQFRALSALRAVHGRSRPDGLLFVRGNDPALADRLDDANESPDIRAYFNDAIQGVGDGPLPGLLVLLEVFCAADHGTVLGYESADGGRVRPVLGPEPTAAQAWGMPTVRSTIERFAEHIHLDPATVAVDADLRVPLRAVVDGFWSRPDRDEAEVWGEFPFEGSSGADAASPLAPPTPLWDLAERKLRRRGPHAWYHWQSAILQRSGTPTRLATGALDVGRSLRSFLRAARR